MLLAFAPSGRLSRIARCELLVNKHEIYPNNSTEITLRTTLNDSIKIYSTTPQPGISFLNYKFTLEGPAKIERSNKKSVVIKVTEEAYKNPFIRLKVQLKRNPQIVWEKEFPVLYDVEQSISFFGKNGYNPQSSTSNGYRKVKLTKRVNLVFIDNGQTLSNNSGRIEGDNGPNLTLYVSMIKGFEKQEYVKVEIETNYGDRQTKYLRPKVGLLEISTIGGNGGISENGGRGGNGGDVTIYVKNEARQYLDQVFIQNQGGEGGPLWRPKVDGHKEGPYGDQGEIKIIDWE